MLKVNLPLIPVPKHTIPFLEATTITHFLCIFLQIFQGYMSTRTYISILFYFYTNGSILYMFCTFLFFFTWQQILKIIPNEYLWICLILLHHMAITRFNWYFLKGHLSYLESSVITGDDKKSPDNVHNLVHSYKGACRRNS